MGVSWDNVQLFASLLVLYPNFRDTGLAPAIFPAAFVALLR
jgi:hypothetical protein